MKILFLTISRINDITQRGIYTDLVRELVRRGHEVYVASPVERRYKQSEQVIEFQGVKILTVKTLNLQKTNVIEKGIGTLLLEFQFKKAIRKHWGEIHFDLVMYSTPPITFNNVIEWQKSKGARTYLILKDIFPQNAVDLGMMRVGGLLWRLFRKKEQRLYQISDRIGCMSPANCQYIIKHNPDIDALKIEICPNSVDLSLLPEKATPRDNTIFKQYGFDKDKLLFIYGGNLGKPQGIDYIIKVLDRVKCRDDVQFCIVGSGTEKAKLQAWYNATNPANIKVLSALPKDDYDNLVSAADVGMIFLDPRFTIPNFPSRLLTYLENKIPVLLATDSSTDIGRIAESEGFGLWAQTDDIDKIVANINYLISNANQRETMGRKGYQFLLDNYTIDKAADVIERLNHT